MGIFSARVVQIDVHPGDFGPEGLRHLIVRDVLEPNLVVVPNSYRYARRRETFFIHSSALCVLIGRIAAFRRSLAIDKQG